MFPTYKLPRFLDYLYDHYRRYYDMYVGKLTELFPSDESSEATLTISEDDTTSKADRDRLYHLWLGFK